MVSLNNLILFIICISVHGPHLCPIHIIIYNLQCMLNIDRLVVIKHQFGQIQDLLNYAWRNITLKVMYISRINISIFVHISYRCDDLYRESM